MGSESSDEMPQHTSGEDYTRYLMDRIQQLKSRYDDLKVDYQRVESEKRAAESKKVQYEREIRKLQSELDRLRTPPLIIGTIIDELGKGKLIIKSSTGSKFLVNSSQFINEKDLRAGNRVALNQQSLAVLEVLPSSKDPAVRGMEVIDSPNITFEDIGGLGEQILVIKEIVELPLLKPELFEKVGIEPPNGLLLHGPPGTGKTMLAKAVARNTNAAFIRVIGSELVQKYIGEGARMVRELFEMAQEKTPSIIFIDEIDAIAARRMESATSGDREVQRTLMQLLAEMDGFDTRGNVKIIAATNRLDILDPAILRPGRFDRMVEVPIPDIEGRRRILEIHVQKLNLAGEIDLDSIAAKTDGNSGADLSAIAMEAGMFAIRDEREQILPGDFDKALDKVLNARGKKDDEKGGPMFA